MAINPINSEQQNAPREVNANQFYNSQLIQKLLTPEIRALVEKYVNQPLLLETLLLQKNENALITLKTENKGSSEINRVVQLNIPPNLSIGLDKLINQLKNAENISITVSSNQQIQISVIAKSPNANETTPVTTLQTKPNQPQVPLQTLTIQLHFTKQEISSSGLLILSQPVSTTSRAHASKTPDTTLINTIQTVDLNKKLGEIASSLISSSQKSSPSKPNNILTTNIAQIETITGQLKENVSTVLSSSTLINKFVQLIENLGLQKLSNKKDTSLDLKTIESTKSLTHDFIRSLGKFNIEIQKLFEAITKPIALEQLTQADTAQNTKNLVSRLIKSGNLFENALKMRVAKNDTTSLSHSSKIPSDNKLLLNQLNNQIEKLLLEIIRYSEKPVSSSQIEKIANSLITQVKEFTPLEKHQLETSKKNAILKNQNQQEQLQNVIKLSKSLQVIINSSLQQIEQNQLHSLKSEQFNLQQFLVDLPIKQNGMIDSFEMRFESPGEKNNSIKKRYWKVVVKFDLEPLGPMFAEIQFENERISTHIFAEKKETAVLINQHLPTLRKSLFSAGVDVNKVSGSQGNIPENLYGQDKPSIDAHA